MSRVYSKENKYGNWPFSSGLKVDYSNWVFKNDYVRHTLLKRKIKKSHRRSEKKKKRKIAPNHSLRPFQFHSTHLKVNNQSLKL